MISSTYKQRRIQFQLRTLYRYIYLLGLKEVIVQLNARLCITKAVVKLRLQLLSSRSRILACRQCLRGCQSLQEAACTNRTVYAVGRQQCILTGH